MGQFSGLIFASGSLGKVGPSRFQSTCMVAMKMQTRRRKTYHYKRTAAFVQSSQTLFLVDLRHYQKRVSWRRDTFLASQLHSCLCKFKRVLFARFQP